MEQKTGNSIWDDMPLEWIIEETKQRHDEPEESKAAVSPEEPEEVNNTQPEDPLENQDKSEAAESVPKAEPDKKEQTKKEKNKEKAKKQKERKEKINKKLQRENRKIDKEKYREFEEKRKKSRESSATHVREAYQREKQENKHDFIILGSVLAVIILGIGICVSLFTNTASEKVYKLIDQGKYGTAYQSIREYHETGKNVDSMVYEFAVQCVENSEHKRAVASLEFLSEKACENKAFFGEIIEKCISVGKTNRAQEIIWFMKSQGAILSTYAEELCEKYGLE